MLLTTVLFNYSQIVSGIALTFVVIVSSVLLSCYERGERMDYMTELAAIAKAHGGIIEKSSSAAWHLKGDAL